MKTDKEYAELLLSGDWATAGTDTQYKIIEEDDETIIVFAESNSKMDWKINFNFPKKAYKKEKQSMYVHRGFLKEWKLIRDILLNYVEGAFYIGSVKKITVVGWSYGGAMATLCMEDLFYSFPTLRSSLELITFGSPRLIGCWNFKKVKHVWENTTRYHNGSDIVACVPFLFMGFRHIKKEVHIGKKKCLFRFFNPHKNHDIVCYIDSLNKL